SAISNDAKNDPFLAAGRDEADSDVSNGEAFEDATREYEERNGDGVEVRVGATFLSRLRRDSRMRARCCNKKGVTMIALLARHPLLEGNDTAIECGGPIGLLGVKQFGVVGGLVAENRAKIGPSSLA
ncbi:hypothetical protein QC281_49490, partial [Streptomyces sp. DH17]|nr:hypothetical protein [Streptomyces sp. DH17]